MGFLEALSSTYSIVAHSSPLVPILMKLKVSAAWASKIEL